VTFDLVSCINSLHVAFHRGNIFVELWRSCVAILSILTSITARFRPDTSGHVQCMQPSMKRLHDDWRDGPRGLATDCDYEPRLRSRRTSGDGAFLEMRCRLNRVASASARSINQRATAAARRRGADRADVERASISRGTPANS